MRVRVLAVILFAAWLASAWVSAQAGAVTSHPRLWVRADDLPRLRSWAVETNPIYRDGLARLADEAKADMDAGRVPGGDPGDLNYREFPTEIYAELFAFMSLVSPDQASRDDYAGRARQLLMHAMNLAVQGPAEGQPFRDPCFASCDSNASKDYGEGFALTVDWIYPTLSAADKATIRTVFLRWSGEIVRLGYHAPEPAGVVNNPVLVRDKEEYRWALNNYFVAHMRNLGLMAMAMDADDDPGNALRNYLRNATGARLYMLDYLTRNDARGGLPPEGLEYGTGITLPAIAEFLLALHTAGEDDPARWGSQVAFFRTNPFWDDWIAGWLQTQSPVPVIFDDYIGPEYQPAWYGDGERYGGRETINVFGPIGLYDAMTGNASRLAAIRWMQAHLPPGGIEGLVERARNPNSFSIDIFYFLLFDPAAGTGVDPRPSQPLHFFSPGLGRILSRTGWDANASWFSYKLSWATIDHQVADGNQFEFYRRGEWLLKERTGYDLDSGASINHNTLSLQNDAGPWEPSDYRYVLSRTGSQWIYAPARDPRLVAQSAGPGFVYALGDATNLYNYANDLTDITHASRSIVWLKPDDIVVYDRAASKTAGRFKRFWLNLPEQPTVSGRQARMASGSGGQQLIVTTLLPADAVPVSREAEVLAGDPAENEPTRYRLQVDAPGGPQSVRFLHVLQGADTGAATSTPALIQSSAGTAFAGAVVSNTAVVFPVDINATFSGVTYAVPVGTTEHLVTGLTPNAAYGVSVSASGGGLTVTVSAGGGTRRADSGGVLVISVSGAATASAPPSRAATVTRALGARDTVSRPTAADIRASNLLASASGSGVVLTWTAPPGAAPLRYAIGGGPTRHASTLPIIVTPDASTRYTIPAVPRGTYYFRVSSIFPAGVTPPSDDAAVSAAGSPSATGPPRAALAMADAGRLTAAWTGAPGATTYQVEIGRAPGLADVATLTTTATSLAYHPPPATYFMRVRAVRGSAVSAPSNDVSLPVAAEECIAAPLTPTVLPVSEVDGEATISWLPARGAPATSYRVDGTGPSGPVTVRSGGASTSAVAVLIPGDYSIRVTALNACGVSAPSEHMDFIVTDRVAPPGP